MIEEKTEVIESESIAIFEQASAIKVCNEESYKKAGELLVVIKKLKNKINEFFEPMKSKSYAAWKEICSEEKKALLQLENANELVRKEVDAFLTAIEVKRKKEQEEAEKAAAIIAEKQKQILLERAIKAKTIKKQEELLEKAENIYTEPVVIDRKIDKTIKTENGSITSKKDIEVTIIDPLLLIKAIAGGGAPITIVDFKLSVVKSWIKAAGIKNIQGLLIKEVSKISINKVS